MNITGVSHLHEPSVNRTFVCILRIGPATNRQPKEADRKGNTISIENATNLAYEWMVGTRSHNNKITIQTRNGRNKIVRAESGVWGNFCFSFTLHKNKINARNGYNEDNGNAMAPDHIAKKPFRKDVDIGNTQLHGRFELFIVEASVPHALLCAWHSSYNPHHMHSSIRNI